MVSHSAKFEPDITRSVCDGHQHDDTSDRVKSEFCSPFLRADLLYAGQTLSKGCSYIIKMNYEPNF